MKNQYITPAAVIVSVGTILPLNASGVFGIDGSINYGGIDQDGTVHADSRRRRQGDLWEDEEEEENW